MTTKFAKFANLLSEILLSFRRLLQKACLRQGEFENPPILTHVCRLATPACCDPRPEVDPKALASKVKAR